MDSTARHSEDPTPAGPGSIPTAPSALGAEVRESLLLLTFAVGVTVGLTTAAQAALAVLS
ncbi:MAG: hypothetical protein JWN88_1323 [Frankiales bacterium]|jgi:hypothetical protein|nr:hypothetical protein [Frankiales bacterium]